MPTKLRLTQKKAASVERRKPPVIKGSRLNYNAAIEERYVRELTSLVKQMTAQTQREIARYFKHGDVKQFFGTAQDASPSAQARILTDALTKKFNDLFARRAPGISERMVKASDRASASSVHGSLKKLSGGLSVKTSFLTGDMKQVVNASIVENVSLIKSIAQKYLGEVQQSVMRSITTGNGLETLQPALEKYEGMTIRRARNIALDQTRKAYNNINKERMKRAGVGKFEWVHSGGSQHPRELHISYDGQIFSFDDPPVIDENTGERGIPGQAINCRCTMVPVVEFGEGDE